MSSVGLMSRGTDGAWLKQDDTVEVWLGPHNLLGEPRSRIGAARVAHVKRGGRQYVGLELLGQPCLSFRAPLLVGESPAIRQIKTMLPEIAGCELNVLIRGESGSGKNVLAEAIHLYSKGPDKPLIRVNSASIPDTLFESQLFGHEKGAFTDARTASPGCFRLAGEGTILLDEISEISAHLQAKLLRVIEDKRFLPVGGSKSVSVKARIIATTNADLEALRRDGSFRNDLFYRLNEVTVDLPSLRQRPEDMPLLADYFLHKYSRQLNKPYRPLSAERVKELADYPWPGNVRELENTIKRTVLLGRFQSPRLHALNEEPEPEASLLKEAVLQGVLVSGKSLKTIREEVTNATERRVISATLTACDANRTLTAQRLGISYRTLLRKLAKYAITA